jgi:hypothetical protein
MARPPRHGVQHDLVDQARGQRLLGDADPADRQDVLPVRDRTGLLYRGGNTAGHEHLAGAAAHLDPLLAAVGHDEGGSDLMRGSLVLLRRIPS